MPEKDSNRKFTKHLTHLKVLFAIYADFESKFKKLTKVILTNHILINVKCILLAVMDTKWYVFMIHLVNQCKHIKVKMQLTGLMKKIVKKLNIVKKL